MNRITLAASELYSKFRSMVDTLAWVDIVGTRFQPLDDALLAVQAARFSFTTDNPLATINDPLTRLAASFGYNRGAGETDASVIVWGQAYARACKSSGNLDDLLYVAGLVYGAPAVGMTSNETGPSRFGTHQDSLSVTLESSTDAGQSIDTLSEVNKCMGLLLSMADATTTLTFGFDLRERAYLTGGTLPEIPRSTDDGPCFAFDGRNGAHFDTGGMYSLIDSVIYA